MPFNFSYLYFFTTLLFIFSFFSPGQAFGGDGKPCQNTFDPKHPALYKAIDAHADAQLQGYVAAQDIHPVRQLNAVYGSSNIVSALRALTAVSDSEYFDVLFHPGMKYILGLETKSRDVTNNFSAALVLSHPAIFDMFASTVIEAGAEHSDDPDIIIKTYRTLLTQLTKARHGESNEISERVQAFQRLSIVNFRPFEAVALGFSDTLTERTSRGYFLPSSESEFDFSSQFRGVANDSLVLAIVDRGYEVTKVDFDNATLEDQHALAAALKIQMMTTISERWDRAHIFRNQRFYNGFYPRAPSTPKLSQTVFLEFYDRKNIESWQPPGDIKLVSKSEAGVEVKLTHPSQILLLDLDMRIVKFQFLHLP